MRVPPWEREPPAWAASGDGNDRHAAPLWNLRRPGEGVTRVEGRREVRVRVLVLGCPGLSVPEKPESQLLSLQFEREQEGVPSVADAEAKSVVFDQLIGAALKLSHVLAVPRTEEGEPPTLKAQRELEVACFAENLFGVLASESRIQDDGANIGCRDRVAYPITLKRRCRRAGDGCGSPLSKEPCCSRPTSRIRSRLSRSPGPAGRGYQRPNPASTQLTPRLGC